MEKRDINPGGRIRKQPIRATRMTLSQREDALGQREDAVARREHALEHHEAPARPDRGIQGPQPERLLVECRRLRYELSQARREIVQTRAEREQLLAQMREANQNLVIASMHADETAELADAGRSRAETLAAQLAKSEAAMRDSEKQFRTIANMVPMLAWYADPDGNIGWFNDRWYEYTGTRIEDQAGSNWRSAHEPSDLPRVISSWGKAIVSGTAWEDTFRLKRHDGELRWFLARALPLRDETGRTVRWFGTSVDIDEQKRAEGEIRAASRAKDEFLAILGHELRNPLAPILTALELMKMGSAVSASREVAIIERQVRHMVRLVDDLLDVSRIAGGKVSLTLAPIELADVVSHAVEMVGPLIKASEQNLSLSVAATGLLVSGDRVRLSQIVTNLLINAAKYTPSRGGIDVTAGRRGSTVSLRIRDNGIGISSDMLPRVFSLFAQERQPLDRARGGLGLGLAIVRSLVEMHGGKVSARSDGLGRGSEFLLELPSYEAGAVRQEAAGRGPVPGAPVGSSQLDIAHAYAETRRILVVDDNRDAAELLADVLGAYGHEVRVAFDGRAALALMDEFVPDVAVLDIGLPLMDGYELAQRLLEKLAPRRPALIALTGYGQDRDRRRTHEAGFDVHLVKPIDSNQIRDAIRKVSAKTAAG